MHDEAGDIVRDEEKIGPERRAVAADRDLATIRRRAGGEMATLVELAIIRQMNLRHDTEQPAAVNRQRAIIEPPRLAQRCADEDERHQIDGGRDEPIDAAHDGFMQCVLQQEIVDRIARQSEFGKDRERG